MYLDAPSTNKPIASLYFPQLSPIAAFRPVYSGSMSMRCAVLTVFGAFCEASGSTPFGLDSDREEGLAVEMGSGRLRAEGSMSGIAQAGGQPAGNA